MRKTSAAGLSLLFASCNAVKLEKVEGYEAVDDQAEGVHVLDIGANTMSNSPDQYESVMDFPGPIRTAFYAQTGSEYTRILNQIITQNRLSDFEFVKLVNSVKQVELNS